MEYPADELFKISHQRLLPSPSILLSDQPSLSADLERKILALQAKEELSQANSCILLPMLLEDGHFESGYEIGVGLGLHMLRLLEATTITKLSGVVDRKAKFDKKEYNKPEEEIFLKKYIEKQFEFSDSAVDLFWKPSLEVAQAVPDQSIDFVYFDGEYLLHSIEENLIAWFPKVRKGGIIAGYQTSTFFPNLTPSIKNFFSERNFEVFQDKIEPKFWWIKK